MSKVKLKENNNKFIPYWYDEREEKIISNLDEFFEEKIGEDDENDIFELKYFYQKNNWFNIDFSTEDTPFCCAVLEIGQIDFSKTTSTEVLDQLFNSILTSQNGRTMLINTIKDLKHLEEYLSKSELFTLVKTFKNPNTGNTIKMWVSNN